MLNNGYEQIVSQELRNSLNDKICVIVPAKGDCDSFGKCIDSLINLDYSPFEIIIVDDGLTRGALAQLESFSRRIKILNSQSRGPSYARNLAAQHTDAEFLAFTDSDCMVDKDWLKELKRGLDISGGKFIGCGGVQELPCDASFFEKKVFRFIKKAGIIADYGRSAEKGGLLASAGEIKPISDSRSKFNAVFRGIARMPYVPPRPVKLKEVKHNASCNVMYRKDIFLAAGGFQEGLWPSEDVELDYRLIKNGYKLSFNPSAVVYHYRPKDFKSFKGMMFRYGSTASFLIKKYGFFRPVYFVPLFLAFLLVFLALSILFNFFLAYLSTLAVSVFLLFVYLQSDFWLFKLAISAVFYWSLGLLKGLKQAFIK